MLGLLPPHSLAPGVRGALAHLQPPDPALPLA